jgi:hypothetical protein
MATIPRFDAPGGLTDFGEAGLAAWDERMNQAFESNVRGVRAETGAASQFYNPRVTSTDPPVATRVIRWKGFPLVIQSRHPGDTRAAWEEADKPAADGSRRQDEYLEWHVARDGQGKITRVTFTTEGPEYWETLAEHDPDKVVELYQRHVSRDVKRADLFAGGSYNPLNKWNTKQGAMHLSHGDNTLGAEINIAARATVIRERNGQVLTGAQELINCSRFGLGARASDPHIGEEVNSLARQGLAITLQNPIGLYIAGAPNTTGWRTPDNTPASQFWRVTRGTADMIVGATFEVPADRGFTVGDIKIGGLAIEFGGQIADFLDVKLTGVACRAGQINNPARPCPGFGGDLDAEAAPAPGLRSRLASRQPGTR